MYTRKYWQITILGLVLNDIWGNSYLYFMIFKCLCRDLNDSMYNTRRYQDLGIGFWWNNKQYVSRMSTNLRFNNLRPRQNGRHIAYNIFKCILLNENFWIPIKISLKFVPQGPINNIPALVKIMAWRRPGDKPLSEPMMVRLPTHICVTRPQWVNRILVQYILLCIRNECVFVEYLRGVSIIWNRTIHLKKSGVVCLLYTNSKLVSNSPFYKGVINGFFIVDSSC